MDYIFAFLYGIFVVTIIQVDLNNNSGDIGSLLKFFNTFRNLEFFIQNHTFQVHDYVFRYVVIYLHTFLNLSFLDLLKIISFTISFIISCGFRSSIFSILYTVFSILKSYLFHQNQIYLCSSTSNVEEESSSEACAGTVVIQRYTGH